MLHSFFLPSLAVNLSVYYLLIISFPVLDIPGCTDQFSKNSKRFLRWLFFNTSASRLHNEGPLRRILRIVLFSWFSFGTGDAFLKFGAQPISLHRTMQRVAALVHIHIDELHAQTHIRHTHTHTPSNAARPCLRGFHTSESGDNVMFAWFSQSWNSQHNFHISLVISITHSLGVMTRSNAELKRRIWKPIAPRLGRCRMLLQPNDRSCFLSRRCPFFPAMDRRNVFHHIIGCVFGYIGWGKNHEWTLSFRLAVWSMRNTAFFERSLVHMIRWIVRIDSNRNEQTDEQISFVPIFQRNLFLLR